MLVRDGVRPDEAGGEPVNFGKVRVLSGIHGDLQKWDHQ